MCRSRGTEGKEVARKDYDDRRRRQRQGQEWAKAAGLYKGRQENVGRNNGIANMLRAGATYADIHAALGCSRMTIAKIAKRIVSAQRAEAEAVESKSDPTNYNVV